MGLQMFQVSGLKFKVYRTMRAGMVAGQIPLRLFNRKGENRIHGLLGCFFGRLLRICKCGEELLAVGGHGLNASVVQIGGRRITQQ